MSTLHKKLVFLEPRKIGFETYEGRKKIKT